MTYFLGIDLGTTYSAVGVAVDGKIEIAHLGARASTIPSVVFLREDGEMLVGEQAQRRAAIEPARAAREFKRRLGDPAPLIVGGAPLSAESVMAHLLRAIVRRVAEEQGSAPAAICLTHPASYGPFKLDLLHQMVTHAEAGPVQFLPEPVAAALHYASQERIDPGTVVAVYDFGGGTFDAAVLRKTADSFEILGQPQGLERLGGIDFDEAVFEHVAAIVGRAVLEGDGSAAARQALVRLREECREAKESLSTDTESTIPVLIPSYHSEVRLTRAELEQVARPSIRETIAALERSVRSAGFAFQDIDRILLVGGSSRMPLVGQMVREATGRPVSLDVHPKHAIALGAALFAREHASAAAIAASPASVVRPPEPAATVPPRVEPAPPTPVEALPGVATPPAAPIVRVPPPQAAARAGGAPRRKMLIAAAAVAVVLAVAGGAAIALLSGGGSASAAARITDLQLNNGVYQAWFTTTGFTPSSSGQRVHFYWNSINESEAGSNSTSDYWAPYWGSSPVGFAASSERPAEATKICIVVADADARVSKGSGNCWNLPR